MMDRLPNVTFKCRVKIEYELGPIWDWKDITTDELFKSKNCGMMFGAESKCMYFAMRVRHSDFYGEVNKYFADYTDVKNFEKTGELPTCLKCDAKTKIIVRLENESTKFRVLSEDLGKAVNGRPLTEEEVADFENQMWDLKIILDPIINRLDTLGKTQ